MIKLFRTALIALLMALGCALPAYAQKTQAQLNTEIGVNFPDNTTNFITPLLLRNTTLDMVNSIMPTAPVVSGNFACFNGTTGLLQDCGSSPSTIVIPNSQLAPMAARSVKCNPTGSSATPTDCTSLPFAVGGWKISNLTAANDAV